jgi:transcriptional regulator with XRE-family HTH domain
MTGAARNAERLGRATERALEAAEKFDGQNGAQTIETALAYIADTRAELARLSGMTPETLRAIERGKRPTRAQKAALAWAIVKRWT